MLYAGRPIPFGRCFATRAKPLDFTEDVKDQVEFKEATKINDAPTQTGNIFHARWDIPTARAIAPEHLKPKTIRDHLAHSAVWLCRTGYDFFSGYDFFKHDYKMYARRLIVLETIAGIPGFGISRLVP
ncbi:hypothetical protein Pmar_PMAR023995 [Perkinsus marinus ATCC 50983]|uniref:Uncharacterized protein n=1 Tax=Perkinsus marinus (strain ATCC 50983 / TXsc) TaxID=423536 RepID=C5KYH5_PERM5|nr:hypothetical protein Pmar_PMAR023995 [Perkinsus marinus ATCC 50983]EER10468.1 hypothetical protein Pmar_PMAR023995 [Perkinsus marinus ATCC 50983]|eukprot:XP_002778673.1 hypothetical protein Pmar_PMAR023995 [Perkinsus marinus ATCC 50983]